MFKNRFFNTMQIQNQVQLKPFNTLSLDVTASHYTKITSVEDIKEAYFKVERLFSLIGLKIETNGGTK